jgi:protein-disulfide isomerase
VTTSSTPGGRQLALAPLDENVDHARGSPAGLLIIEYGDYECPYSRQAFHAIELVEQQFGGNMRFAFRHFPLTSIHPRALTAAAAAEAAALQGRFWDMHELLFHRQKALEDADLRRSSLVSTWRRSTGTGPARWRGGSAAMWAAA